MGTMPVLMFVTQLLSLLVPIIVPGVVFIVALKRGWWRALEIPIDGGLTLGGQPLLGPSKTWLGVLVYGAGATLVALALSVPGLTGWVAPLFGGPQPWPALAGLTMGLSYATAELVNSFVKRRLKLASSSITHSGWRPVQSFFDLADGILAVLLVILLMGTDAVLSVSAAVAGLFAHALTDIWMRRLRLKRTN